MKSCDNCYWRLHCAWCLHSSEKPPENTCEKHRYTCGKCDSDEMAEYEYEGKIYCFDCLLDELEIESYEVTHYTCKGEYIASEEDIGQVISEWNKDIKLLGE